MAPPPSASTRRARGALLALGIAAAGALRAQSSAAAVREARFDIAVDSAVIVHAQVRMVGTRGVTLEWRNAPCSRVDAPLLTVNGAAVSFRDSSSGPWRFVLADFAAGADSSVTLDVHYRVRPAGSTWSVPLIAPAVPVRTLAGLARTAVVLTVAAPGGRAVFPAFTTLTPGRFEARLSAVPSLVRLQPTVATPCSDSPARETGELTFRFTLLVLTMLLWIPLYFWWARRREKDA